MEHPNKEQRTNQADFLAKLPEDQREEHARMFRFGNTAYSYHLRANEFEPTELDFNEWLEGLPKNIRRVMEMQGFESCKTIVSFSRYVNEKNDMGMEAWMKEYLSQADYTAYQEVNRDAEDV